MSEQSTLRRVSDFLGRLFTPLREATEDVDAFRAFFLRLGWAVGENDVPSGYLTLADDVLGAIAVIQSLSDDADLSDVEPIFETVSSIYQDLRQLPPPSGVNVSAEDLAKAIIDLLVTDFLVRDLPQVWMVLRHLGLTEAEYHAVGSGSQQRAFVSQRVLWGDLPKVLSDPGSIPGRVYGWGEDTFDFSVLADDLFHALTAFGVHVRTRTLGTAGVVSMQSFVEQPDQMRYGRNMAIDVILMDDTAADDDVEVGVSLLALPGEGSHKPGLVLQPLVPENVAETIDLTDNLQLVLKGSADLTTAFGVAVRPGEDPVVKQPFTPGATPLNGDASVALETTFDTPAVLLGSPSGSRLEVAGLRAAVEFLGATSGAFEARFDVGLKDVSIVLSGGDGDGFIGTVLGGGEKKATFSFGLRWSTRTGLSFSGGGVFVLSEPVNVSIGPIHISNVDLAIAGKQRQSGAGELSVAAGVAVDATIGPVTATVEGIGVHVDIALEAGNAGPFDISAGFKPPTGVGIAVDAGPVSGGGFLTLNPDQGRYAGAVELSVYDIAVKAFGLIETKVPGVSFSFVIVISAEFTPIQLGFGFTLNGVGGLVGIHRTVDAAALANLVRAGQSEELLFPKNLIANAPAIIRDLGTVFPARQGHYVFGPLGKLGWGTPTLITGEIGIFLELPGPVLAILGEVKCLLPKPDQALVKLNLSVGGELNFPKKSFALDAALHDSTVNGFTVSGQMAMRLLWGEQPNFVLSVGGFHPAYQPPKDFPKLQPLALDLGQHGKATITVSGFFAVTSNTVQIGGEARLHAGGSGISLDASISVKALFVFSPFSFQANVDASVKISFHGHGPSVHLSGLIEGPSPWHVRGEVCVSILFWDACLRFDETFGGGTRPSVPELDPWDPKTPSGATTLVGLKAALQDAGNWSGVAPTGSASIVSRVQGSEALVDPLGGLSVHQKSVPVETDQPISRFGVAKVRTPISYKLRSASFGSSGTLSPIAPNKDFFAPAQFFQMDDGKKLSAAGFEQRQSGYVLAENASNLRRGSARPRTIAYTTYVVGSDGSFNKVDDFPVSNAQVAGLNTRSATARGGFMQAGTRRFIDRLVTQPFELRPPTFVLASTTALTAITGGPVAAPRSSALLSLDAFRSQNPEQRLQVQVVALHELA